MLSPGLERWEIFQHFSFSELDDILHLNKIINDRKSGQKLLSDSVEGRIKARLFLSRNVFSYWCYQISDIIIILVWLALISDGPYHSEKVSTWHICVARFKWAYLRYRWESDRGVFDFSDTLAAICHLSSHVNALPCPFNAKLSWNG